MNGLCRLLAAMVTLAWPVAATGAAGATPKPEARSSPSLAQQAYEADWWHADIVWGHLRFTSTRVGTLADSVSVGGRVESIDLLAKSPTVVVAYRSTSAGETVGIEVHWNGAIALTREYGPDGRRVAFRLTQPLEGTVSMQLDTASGTRAFEAVTLWHLWLAYPEICREQLAPLLAIVDPTRTMERKLVVVDTELRRLAVERPFGVRPDWTTWVKELSSDCFHRREAAHQALLVAGPGVLWHLEGWSEHPSAERGRRLVRLRRALTGHPADDSVAGAVAWLAGDPSLARMLKCTRSSPAASGSGRTGSG